MKVNKKALAQMMAFTLMVGTCAGHYTFAGEKVTSSSQAYVDAMEPGWNLGNTFDSFDTNGDRGEQSWGNPIVTRALIHKVKEQGFKSIRLPFTAHMRTGSAPDYKLDQNFLDRYAEVVNWALEEGLYVMVNVHHDSWTWANAIGGDDGTAMKRYKAIWTQMADYFKDYPETVCFESLNEPQFWYGATSDQIKITNEVNDAFYQIVRNSGGKNADRMLVLPTLNTGSEQEKLEGLYDEISKLNDDHIIATMHYYGYWPFSVNIAGETSFGQATINELNDSFDRVHETFTTNGIGVICGEYGLLGFDTALETVEPGEILKYFEYVNYYAKDKDITLMLWDNGQHLGRTSYEWSNPDLYEMMHTSWETRSSYGESDRIFVTDATKAKEVSMKLTLNGNSLVSISDGTNTLVEGKDYTYTNDTITFKGSYINRVVTGGNGTNETLKLKFSQGMDWKIDIIKYAMPKASAANGSTTGFTFPMTYNGAKLSTMEAVNANGQGVGPQSWTTYKQFGAHFTPNYDQNTMTIPSDFFAETSDGTMTLKFHWQSGEVTEYTLVKYGSNVTGTPVQVEVESPSPSEPAESPSPSPSQPGTTVSKGIEVAVTTNANGGQSYTVKATEESIDLSKLTLRYYFNKSDAKAMNFWCDNGALNLNQAPWYTNITSSVKGKVVVNGETSYLEMTITDAMTLAPKAGSLVLGVRVANEDWSTMTNFEAGQVVVLYDGAIVVD